MIPDNMIFPVLKSSEWSEHDEALADRLSVPSDDPRLPWVAYGALDGVDFEPLRMAEIEESRAEDLKEEALRNLQDLPASWQPVEGSSGPGGRASMLGCFDDELAAERILDTEFMLRAQDQLRTEILAVGIPRRGHLVVVDGRQADASLTRFGAYNLGQFHSRESEPITSLTVLMEEGEFSGLLQFMT